MCSVTYGFFILCLISMYTSTFQFVVETSAEFEVERDPSLQSAIDAHIQPSLEEDLTESDFPNFTQIPYGIRFSCRNRVPGFYANPQTHCQVYHHCLPDGRSYAFLCGVGTIFNQRALTCDHWYNYNCAEAEEDYKYNNNFYQDLFNVEGNDVVNVASSSSKHGRSKS